MPVVRRISGGGAVYHDLGNVNFTFIGTTGHYDLDLQFDIVLEALAGLGITARRSERNDLLIGELKISGNAFRHAKGLSLHHGTLLLSSDLESLGRFLVSEDRGTISTRAIHSVRSRVTNLRSVRPTLTYTELVDALFRSFAARAGDASAVRRVVENAGEPHISDEAKTELRSWEWRFARTPAFSRVVELEGGAVELSVVRGRVDAVVSATVDVSRLASRLRGVRYVGADIREAAGHINGAEAIAESARI